MPYAKCFTRVIDGILTRECVKNDDLLVEVLADALMEHDASPPKSTVKLTNQRQGNLSEYCVWDIGDRHWTLFEKGLSKPANADSPWKDGSDPGIDILALSLDDPPLLLVIEAKSSINDGVALINGKGSSIRSDFTGLLANSVNSRLLIRVGAFKSQLRFVAKKPELLRRIDECVGDTPKACSGVKLMGVLVCKRGETKDENARRDAFNALRDNLVSDGWAISNIDLRTVEAGNLSKLLTEVIERVTC